MKRLNLSHNQIDDHIAEIICDFLLTNDSVEDLSLAWNKLGTLTGSYIAEALEKNEKLKVLDLSFNCLGRDSHLI